MRQVNDVTAQGGHTRSTSGRASVKQIGSLPLMFSRLRRLHLPSNATAAPHRPLPRLLYLPQPPPPPGACSTYL
jgi:hypothetical protein